MKEHTNQRCKSRPPLGSAFQAVIPIRYSVLSKNSMCFVCHYVNFFYIGAPLKVSFMTFKPYFTKNNDNHVHFYYLAALKTLVLVKTTLMSECWQKTFVNLFDITFYHLSLI